MELLDNAIESIQVGVEDYQSGTRSRLLSAVRNIHAGILLLYKEALRRMSPAESNDALMMARIVPSKDPNGKVVFIGEGKKTADTQQIKDRFDTLGIKTDWKRFDRINETRNEVEHLYPRLDQKGLEGLIPIPFCSSATSSLRNSTTSHSNSSARKLGKRCLKLLRFTRRRKRKAANS